MFYLYEYAIFLNKLDEEEDVEMSRVLGELFVACDPLLCVLIATTTIPSLAPLVTVCVTLTMTFCAY